MVIVLPNLVEWALNSSMPNMGVAWVAVLQTGFFATVQNEENFIYFGLAIKVRVLEGFAKRFSKRRLWNIQGIWLSTEMPKLIVYSLSLSSNATMTKMCTCCVNKLGLIKCVLLLMSNTRLYTGCWKRIVRRRKTKAKCTSQWRQHWMQRKYGLYTKLVDDRCGWILIEQSWIIVKAGHIF